jgi:hypothetical protein
MGIYSNPVSASIMTNIRQQMMPVYFAGETSTPGGSGPVKPVTGINLPPVPVHGGISPDAAQFVLDDCFHKSPDVAARGALRIPLLPTDEMKVAALKEALAFGPVYYPQTKMRGVEKQPFSLDIDPHQSILVTVFAIRAIPSIQDPEVKQRWSLFVLQDPKLSLEGLYHRFRLFKGLASAPKLQDEFVQQLLDPDFRKQPQGWRKIRAGVELLGQVNDAVTKTLLIQRVRSSKDMVGVLTRDELDAFNRLAVEAGLKPVGALAASWAALLYGRGLPTLCPVNDFTYPEWEHPPVKLPVASK